MMHVDKFLLYLPTYCVVNCLLIKYKIQAT